MLTRPPLCCWVNLQEWESRGGRDAREPRYERPPPGEYKQATARVRLCFGYRGYLKLVFEVESTLACRLWLKRISHRWKSKCSEPFLIASFSTKKSHEVNPILLQFLANRIRSTLPRTLLMSLALYWQYSRTESSILKTLFLLVLQE